MKLKVALPGLIVLTLAILACSFSGILEKPKINSYPPFETKAYTEQKNDDAKMRYVIADMQLGGKQVEDYYRQYASQDPIIQQAITDYDNNVRIVNIYQFNRIYIENQGWQIIYGGTDNIIIQAEDVVLTDDIKGTADFDVRVRYMLADMQLGNVVDYYRQFTDDLAVATAVKWWDIGVRVENIQQFERKIVGFAGWKVVYIGTENMIQGMDIKLVGECQAKINYILADIKLGNVLDYYSARTNELAVSEAIKLWKQNVRVSNINDFERKTVRDLGWKVTYKGTNIPIFGTEAQIPQEFVDVNRKCDITCQPWSFFWGLSLSDAYPSGVTLKYKITTFRNFGGYEFEFNNLHLDGRVQNFDSGTECSLSADYKNLQNASIGHPVGLLEAYDLHPDGNTEFPETLKIGDSFLSSSVWGSQTEEYWVTVVSQEKITVPAGTFDSFRLEGKPNQSYNWVKTIWIVKGVGVVKIENSNDDVYPFLLELIQISGINVGASSVSATSTPTENEDEICNKYWPVKEGTYWNYKQDWQGSNISTYTVSIISVYKDGTDIIFDMLNAKSADDTITTYRCNENGVFDMSNNERVFPAESALADGNTWQEGGITFTVGYETVTVSAGTFYALRICGETEGGSGCTYYAEGVGRILTVYEPHIELLDFGNGK